MARTSEEIKAAARRAGNPAAVSAEQNKGNPLGGFLSQIGARGRQNAWRTANVTGSAQGAATGTGTGTATATPPDVQEDPIGAVAGAGADLVTTGDEDFDEQQRVREANLKAAAKADAAARAGQDVTRSKLDAADRAAEGGLEDIQADIADTRETVDAMPDAIRTEFEGFETKIDAAIEAARTGLGEQRFEALSNVMQGRTEAMIAATESIHGNISAQESQIDAQVSSGALSPAQGQQMKNQLRMGGAMQLGAIVGQTAQAFTQMQAQVATSFGNMFTQMEGTAQQVQGAFGTAAGGAFAAATTAKGQFNTALTEAGAMAVANRNTAFSNNAATRATFNFNSDMSNLAMMDYTQDYAVLGTPMAINNLNSIMDIAGMVISDREFKASLDLALEAAKVSDMQGWLGVALSVLESWGG